MSLHLEQCELELPAQARGFHDLTARVSSVVSEWSWKRGQLTVFIKHTSASLIVSENADRQVLLDLEAFANRLVPDGDPLFQHTAEGPDDMPAHVRAVLTATSIQVPITAGRLALGTWQALYLWEHRTSIHRRKLVLTGIGE